MKSNNALIGMALLFLILATASSAVIWGEIASAVKIGMFGFGFGSGIGVGTLISRRAR
ncbi:MAG TPA: hypothetical protein VFZ43_00655 [Anaerolineales bacterium]